jgi:hypothetical protein
VIHKLPASWLAGDWTEANEPDPGITLLELFSFLGEALLVAAVFRTWWLRLRRRARRCRTS